MAPKQKDRSSFCWTHSLSLYIMSHDTGVCTLLLPSRNTGIVADNTNLARTYAGTHNRRQWNLFLSFSLCISIAYVCIRECRPWRMSAADLRTGRRARAPEGSPARDWCVMGGDRSATHASAMTTSPLLVALFCIPPIRGFLGGILGIPPQVDRILNEAPLSFVIFEDTPRTTQSIRRSAELIRVKVNRTNEWLLFYSLFRTVTA